MLPLGILGAKNVFIVALAVAPTQLKQYPGNLGSNKIYYWFCATATRGFLRLRLSLDARLMSNLSVDHAKPAEIWESICGTLWKGKMMFSSSI